MITNIRLQNFRSYKDASFEFEEGVNVIVGPNASGKTNVLEAILVAAQGKSYRAKDIEMVMYKKPWGRIDADFGAKHRVVKIQQENDTTKKTFDLDGRVTSRLSSANKVPVVLFEPNHLQMISGSPELRRTFIDTLTEQTNNTYGSILNKYKRTLLQRNNLLKQGSRAAFNQLFAWDIRLSELAQQIVAERAKTIGEINKHIATTYNQLAQQTNKIKASYSNPTEPSNYGSYLLKKLEQDRPLDLLRGFTGAGPHREDLSFEFNRRPLVLTASRGETRTFLLALKVIELKIVESYRDQKPLLLLDDVFSELDGTRRKALTEFMKDYQTFITTTDADVVTHDFIQQYRVIALAKD